MYRGNLINCIFLYDMFGWFLLQGLFFNLQVIEVQGSVEVVDRLVDLVVEGLVVDLVVGLNDFQEDFQVVLIRIFLIMQLMMIGVDFLWILNLKVQDLVLGLAVVVEVVFKEES